MLKDRLFRKNGAARNRALGCWESARLVSAQLVMPENTTFSCRNQVEFFNNEG